MQRHLFPTATETEKCQKKACLASSPQLLRIKPGTGKLLPSALKAHVAFANKGFWFCISGWASRFREASFAGSKLYSCGISLHFPHAACLFSLLLADIPPILWPRVFSSLLVQWNTAYVFQFFPLFVVTLADCQKGKKENANFIVPSSDSKSNKYVKRIFYTRQKLECLTILLKDKSMLSLLFYW